MADLGEGNCFVCTPGLCAHGPQEPAPSLAEQLAAVKAELATTKADLETALRATKSAWQAFALFEREILRVWRRAKKSSGYTPKPRKPRAVIT